MPDKMNAVSRIRPLGLSPIVVVVVTLALVGCARFTGQTLGAHVDDQTTTAAVKARLVAEHPANLTKVDVDTVDHTVYLKGFVDTPAEKQRATEIGQSVEGVQRVVNNIAVREAAVSAAGSSTGMASPPSASPTGVTVGSIFSGRVTSVDSQTGRLTVETGGAASTALQSVHVGDQVTVQVGAGPAR
jgi:hypothetical protein